MNMKSISIVIDITFCFDHEYEEYWILSVELTSVSSSPKRQYYKTLVFYYAQRT